MKRTRHKRNQTHPDALLTADWHLREYTPTCRRDDFWTTQGNKIVRIATLQEKYGCPIIHAGDLFDHWKPSPLLLSLFIRNFGPSNEYEFYIVYGNHDLPQHNLMLNYRSGTETVRSADCVEVLKESHWEQTPKYESLSWTLSNSESVLSILVWHVMTYKGRAPWPECTDLSAKELLEEYPQYDLIVTGHNHKPFVEELNGRILVNPGSMTRQTADETHRPQVYLWYAKDNAVEPISLTSTPFEDVISREHIERQEHKEQRFEALIEKLNSSTSGSEISFRTNLEQYLRDNKVPKLVRDFIWEIYENRD